MEVTQVALTLVFLTIATWAWRVLNWVWFKPKKLERLFRQQGFSGNPYRLLVGDMNENSSMIKEARSRPSTLSASAAPRVIPLIDQRIKTYGKKSFVWFGPVPRINIMSPEDIRDVFTKMNEYGRTTSLNPIMKMLAAGVAAYEGEKWVRHRKIIHPAFHVEKLKLMAPVVYKACNDMIHKWEALVSAGDGSCELDVWPYLQNFSCDVIARTAFGSNYEEGKRIFDLLKIQADLVIKALQTVYIPGWRFLPTKLNIRMKAVSREIHQSLKLIIDRKEKAMKAGVAAKDDLLGLLMESNFKEMQTNGNKKTEGMSSDDVIEECKLFYFAGQETTSVLLAWTLILLSHHKTWQVAAREEVLQVFGNNVPDFDGLSRLKVVTMILHEVLRLYPPVVALSRLVKEETKLGDLLLPAGTVVSMPTILVHQDPELWGDDASEFNPHRFSEGVAKATKNRVIFFPFGWGPRICIGLNFALVEAKMALVTILQHYSLELSPSYIHAPRTIVTLQPEYGAQIILHKR